MVVINSYYFVLTTCGAELSIWDICAISSDAEAFGLQVKFGYDGHTRITFTPKEQPE